MIRRLPILAGVTLLMGGDGLAQVSEKDSGSADSFAVAQVRFEQNATDHDVEVVIEVKGGSAGLAKLFVVSPDGRTIIDFEAPDPSTLGLRQFRFESPEPRDTKILTSAYPQGAYTFTGTTTTGRRLHGKPSLSHRLPAATSFVYPKAEARSVTVKNLEIKWKSIKNTAAYLVYLEQDELDVSITVKLPGSATWFPVPDGFLRPGTEYTLGIGTVADNGNISFIETTFTTAGKN